MLQALLRVSRGGHPQRSACGRIALQTPAQAGSDREADRCCGQQTSRCASHLRPGRPLGPPARAARSQVLLPLAHAIRRQRSCPRSHAGLTSLPLLAPFHAWFRVPLPTPGSIRLASCPRSSPTGPITDSLLLLLLLEISPSLLIARLPLLMRSGAPRLSAARGRVCSLDRPAVRSSRTPHASLRSPTCS